MRQLFAPGADALFRLGIWSLVVELVVAYCIAYGVSHSDWLNDVAVARAQPVPFSHKHHAGELGLDCRYCHTTVETEATAGIPPTWTCMTCHSQIWTGSPMLAPVRDSLAKNQPLHWTRINRLPSYVYFDHSIHIAKGVGCSSCHGAVDQMQLTYKSQAFTMEFCLTCHRNPQNYVRPKEQIWNMEWTPPADQADLGRALVTKNNIHEASVLTNCSICHR